VPIPDGERYFLVMPYHGQAVRFITILMSCSNTVSVFIGRSGD
jgi:hypothetical protein